MSCAQPTAQYGHTPGNTCASLMRRFAAAASTAVRLMARPPTAAPVAAVPEKRRKSRRERLMTVSYLRAGDAFPDPAEDDYPRNGRAVVTDVSLEPDDVAGIERVHAGDRPVFGHDDRPVVTGQIGAALAPDAQPPMLAIDFDDHEPRLLQLFGKAVGHRAPRDGSSDDAGSSICRYCASCASRSARAAPMSAASRRSITSCLVAGGITGPS